MRLPTYRLYRLDGAGKIVGADWIEAETDEEALVSARDNGAGSRFELWERNRFVADHSSHDGGAPAA
jgi:hypothetical protein